MHEMITSMYGQPISMPTDIPTLFFNITSNNHGWEKDPQTRIFMNDGHPEIEVITPAQITEAYGKVEAGEVQFRYVIDTSKL